MQIVWGIVILILVIAASFGPAALLWLFVGSFAVFMVASAFLLVTERRRG
ncbi:MAG: hypothetical protein V4773_11965 [Verrucomicrobiota bacterium]